MIESENHKYKLSETYLTEPKQTVEQDCNRGAYKNYKTQQSHFPKMSTYDNQAGKHTTSSLRTQQHVFSGQIVRNLITFCYVYGVKLLNSLARDHNQYRMISRQ